MICIKGCTTKNAHLHVLELLVKNKLNQFYIYISFVPPSVKKIENKIDITWDLKAE